MVRLTMVEFPTTDAAGSAAFFDAVFGMSHVSYGPDYTDVLLGNEQSLGFQQDRLEAPDVPLAILEVDDLDAVRGAIEGAGGVVTVEPFGFPGGTRLHFREPGGNELAVWTRARS